MLDQSERDGIVPRFTLDIHCAESGFDIEVRGRDMNGSCAYVFRAFCLYSSVIHFAL
jgi:hypothetical protein